MVYNSAFLILFQPYVYIISQNFKIFKLFHFEILKFCGFQGILVESHNHKENINLSYPMADRPRIELRLDFTLGRISNPLGYHYPTGPSEVGFSLKSLPSPPWPIFIYIPLLMCNSHGAVALDSWPSERISGGW